MKLVIIATIVMLWGCSEAGDRARKLDLMPVNGLVDLQSEVSGNWERVCIFGPYSGNSMAAEVLGFEYDLESKSAILISDSISILVFAELDRTVSFYEMPRSDADFSGLSGQCFPRSDSKFRIYPSQSGWPEVKKV